MEISGRVLTSAGWKNASLRCREGRIYDIREDVEPNGLLVLPGFVDLHCHGGGGADVMEGGEAIRKIARLHASFGTTAFLATTMTAPIGEIESALRAVDSFQKSQQPEEAQVLGVHLEGPFISRTRLGAQPDFVIEGDVVVMERLLRLADIQVVTCAPEADADGSLTELLDKRRVRVQIGHSSCDYETACLFFENERRGVTHMFNAMSPLHHRAPGIVGAALAHAAYAEIIPDLLHVHLGAIRAALRAIPGLYAVSDATAASGMPDGTYRLGAQTVRKCGNGVRLEDGTLAGSSLTMFQAFRNLVAIGMPMEEASRRTATIPADYLGLTDRGRIEIGAISDLVVLGKDLELRSVVIRGVEYGPGHSCTDR